MDPQSQCFFYIIIIDTVLLLIFALLAYVIIQCKRSARKLSNLTQANLKLLTGAQCKNFFDNYLTGQETNINGCISSASSDSQKSQFESFPDTCKLIHLIFLDVKTFLQYGLGSSPSSPSLIRRNELMEKYRDLNFFKLAFKVNFMSDKTLFTVSPNLDTYIYLLFLRMSSIFFLGLTVFNAIVVIPIYSTGDIQERYYETILPQIQKISIANIIRDQPRLYMAFALAIVNFGLLCLFILNFKRKIDYVSSRYTENRYEQEDIMLSGQTLMIQNMPQEIKYHNAEHHTTALFQEMFKGEVVKTKIVPDFQQLIEIMDEKQQLKRKLKRYQQQNDKNNKNIQIKIRKQNCNPFDYKTVDAVEYYEKKINKLDMYIERIQKMEYKTSGTAFVLFNSQSACQNAIQQFKEFQLTNNTFWNKIIKVSDWRVTKAPSKYDLIWKNLDVPEQTRSKTQQVIVLSITVISVMLIIPVAFLERTIAIQPVNSQFELSENPFLYDILNQNVLLVLISTYFSPLALFIGVFLLLPMIIIKLTKYENNYSISLRENSILKKNFYAMIISNILVTGLIMMFVGSYLYLFVKTDSSKLKEYHQDTQSTNFAFKILPQLDFFLRFMIQMIFITFAIHIFTKYIKYRTTSGQMKNKHKYIQWFLKRMVDFDDWYFSFEYQIPFVFSIFTLTFTLSNSIPFILFFGFMFFYLKLAIDFKGRIIYQNKEEIDAQSKHMNETYKKSMLNFLLANVVIFFGVNSIFYATQSEDKKLFYIQLLLLIVSIFLAYYLQKRWQSEEAKNSSAKRQQAKCADLESPSTLDGFYMHPMESNLTPAKPKMVFSKRRNHHHGSTTLNYLHRITIESELNDQLMKSYSSPVPTETRKIFKEDLGQSEQIDLQHAISKNLLKSKSQPIQSNSQVYINDEI